LHGKLQDPPRKRLARVVQLPTALLSEIVGYLDITHDVFFPSLQGTWEKQSLVQHTRFTEGYGKGTQHLVNGQLHSLHDHPAIEYDNGTKKWCWRGLLHRANDNPAIESR